MRYVNVRSHSLQICKNCDTIKKSMQKHTLYLLHICGVTAAKLQAQSPSTVLTQLVISEQLLHYL